MSNKPTLRRFLDDVVNQGKLDVVDEIVGPEFVEHEEFPGLGRDRESVKAFFALFRGAFPNLKFTIEDMVEEGDRVVSRVTMTGTHRGEFMGIAPTGKTVSVAAIDIVRFADGKIMEHWGVTDTAAMMEQLGATATA